MQLRLFTVHQMAPLTERQQKAEGLARWLKNLGAFVTNPMPLAGNQRLRFDVLHTDRNAVLAKLAEQGWAPIQGTIHQRFHRDELVPCTTFELDLPMDPPPVQNLIHGEIATPAKTDVELQGMRRYLGLEAKK